MSSHAILGQKPFQYRINRSWVKASYDEIPVGDCHGLAEDQSGKIYLLHNHPENNVIVLNKNGEVLERWGNEYPQAHGLEITSENGVEYLWITDCKKAVVAKTTLTGQVIFSVGFEQVSFLYSDRNRFAPTNVAVTKEGDFYISDGYGDSRIHHFDPKGKYIHSFGGRGKETYHLNEAHAIWHDDREGRSPSLLICSRQDHAVKRFTLKGEWIETFSLACFWPCNIHFSDGLFYVPHLKNSPHEHGAITIHDASFKIIATLGADSPIYEENNLKPCPETPSNPFIYPHDLHVDEHGNIYLAQWYSGGTYPIRLEIIKEKL